MLQRREAHKLHPRVNTAAGENKTATKEEGLSTRALQGGITTVARHSPREIRSASASHSKTDRRTHTPMRSQYRQRTRRHIIHEPLEGNQPVPFLITRSLGPGNIAVTNTFLPAPITNVVGEPHSSRNLVQLPQKIAHLPGHGLIRIHRLPQPNMPPQHHHHGQQLTLGNSPTGNLVLLDSILWLMDPTDTVCSGISKTFLFGAA